MERLEAQKAELLERVAELRAETGDFGEDTLEEIKQIEAKLEMIEALLRDEEEAATVAALEEEAAKTAPKTEVKSAKNLGEKIYRAYMEHGTLSKGDSLSVQFKAGNDGAIIIGEDYPGKTTQGASVFNPADADDIMSLFNVVNTDSNAINALSWDFTGLDAPAAVADGGYKPQITPTVTPIANIVKKIAGHMVISESILADEAGLLERLSDELRVLMVAARNKELLTGDGTGAHLLGLTAADGIQTVSAGSVLEGIATAVANIKSATGYTADALILDPASWTALVTAQNGAGGFAFPVTSGLDAVAPWGISNVRISNEIDAPIVGAFKRGADVYRRSYINVDVTNSNEDNFVYDLLTIRIWQRLGLHVKNAAAFAKVEVA